MRYANSLILLTDTLSAHFLTQNGAHEVSAGFSAAHVNASRIISLSWLTPCQQIADRLSAGLVTDTLSLFRECHVSGVSRGREKEPCAASDFEDVGVKK